MNTRSCPISVACRVAAVLASLIACMALADAPAGGTLDEDGVQFRLRGRGSFHWNRLVHAYDAALHTGGDAADVDGRPAGALRLEIRYRRAFAARDIARGGDELLKRNLQPPEIEAIRARVDRLHRAYLDVRDGDAYTLTFVPGKGTTLRLNGRPLATIEGDDFVAYFKIWLGPEPISAKLRDQLLGRK